MVVKIKVKLKKIRSYCNNISEDLRKKQMTDLSKFKALTLSSVILIFFVLSYNVFQEYIMPDVKGYFERRIYYEKVISKKGLSLHKGMYWKEKK
jgi:hypothetical protein